MFVFRVFLVLVFPHLYWILGDTLYLLVLSPNARKYGSEKLRIVTLFTQPFLKSILILRPLSRYSLCKNRSSRPDVFYAKGVLKNFTKFSGKYLCRGLLFNKFTGPRPATLLKRDFKTGAFLWILRKFNSSLKRLLYEWNILVNVSIYMLGLS